MRPLTGTLVAAAMLAAAFSAAAQDMEVEIVGPDAHCDGNHVHVPGFADPFQTASTGLPVGTRGDYDPLVFIIFWDGGTQSDVFTDLTACVAPPEPAAPLPGTAEGASLDNQTGVTNPASTTTGGPGPSSQASQYDLFRSAFQEEPPLTDEEDRHQADVLRYARLYDELAQEIADLEAERDQALADADAAAQQAAQAQQEADKQQAAAAAANAQLQALQQAVDDAHNAMQSWFNQFQVASKLAKQSDDPADFKDTLNAIYQSYSQALSQYNRAKAAQRAQAPALQRTANAAGAAQAAAQAQANASAQKAQVQRQKANNVLQPQINKLKQQQTSVVAKGKAANQAREDARRREEERRRGETARKDERERLAREAEARRRAEAEAAARQAEIDRVAREMRNTMDALRQFADLLEKNGDEELANAIRAQLQDAGDALVSGLQAAAGAAEGAGGGIGGAAAGKTSAAVAGTALSIIQAGYGVLVSVASQSIQNAYRGIFSRQSALVYAQALPKGQTAVFFHKRQVDGKTESENTGVLVMRNPDGSVTVTQVNADGTVTGSTIPKDQLYGH